MTARAPFTGAVLTGGASRRMGVDKATLVVDGVAMAVRVADALRAAGATDVVVIGHRPVDGEVHVPDVHPGEGPLGGVLTALAALAALAHAELLVVAPCDLLAPDPRAFVALVDALTAEPDALVAIAGPGDPLPLALRPGAAVTPLADAFAAGTRSLQGAIAPLDPVVVGLPATATASANQPADLPPTAR